MKFKRFTNTKTLRGLGRPLLGRFLDKFRDGLTAKGVALPAESLEDDDYFAALARIFLSPNDQPDDMIEALYAVVEMANDKGAERLLKGVAEKELPLVFDEKSSYLDIAMQVWLADPDLMTEKHSEHRLVALTSFQYFGTKTPVGSRLPFKPPTGEVLELMRADVDQWCAENHRGAETVNITMHELDSEWFFLIQHGGTFTRTPKVEKRKTEVLHYRPGKDDVVVYYPVRDEIRIHAETGGERKLYQEQFGQRLRGDYRYFSETKTYVLDPLREDVDEALSTEGLPDIRRIVLQELEIRYSGEFNDSTVKRSDDMVASATQRSTNGKSIHAVPDFGELVRATFEFHFANSKKPRRVYLRPPNVLRLARHCDARAVHEWLSKREFRAVAQSPASAGERIADAQPVAMP